MTNYGNYYSVFVLAMLLDEKGKLKKDELDNEWERCIDLYAEFYDSEYNDSNKPEMECLEAFIKSKTVLTPRQVAILYFEEGSKGTGSGSWVWNADYIEEIAGQPLDPEDVSDQVWEMFGDWMLDDESTEEQLDMMFGGNACAYMFYSPDKGDTLGDYMKAYEDEYEQWFSSNEEAMENWVDSIKDYHKAQEKLMKLKKEEGLCVSQ